MTYKNAQQLHLPAQMPSQCQFDLFTPKPNAALQSYALSLDKADSPGVDMALGQQFAQRVTLTCH